MKKIASIPFLLIAWIYSWLSVSADAGVSRLPVVAAVSASAIVVQGRTYQVTSNTQIIVDDLPSKIGDVRAGMTAVITQGLDRGTAETIVASTVPPAAPPSKQKTRSLFQKVGSNVVLAITPERITYGEPGTRQAHAAFITPNTRIYIGTARDDISGLTVGLPIDVTCMDGTHADSIRAADPDR